MKLAKVGGQKTKLGREPRPIGTPYENECNDIGVENRKQWEEIPSSVSASLVFFFAKSRPPDFLAHGANNCQGGQGSGGRSTESIHPRRPLPCPSLLGIAPNGCRPPESKSPPRRGLAGPSVHSHPFSVAHSARFSLGGVKSGERKMEIKNDSTN